MTLQTPSQRRLQRAPDFTGDSLRNFRSVFLRHGLPVAAIAVLVLAHPEVRLLLLDGLAPAFASPYRYLVVGITILLALSIYAWAIERTWQFQQFTWIVYLGALSLWEEWVFRIVIPSALEIQGIDIFTALIISNLAFGAIHYFTLRWKWPWCVGAFIGGLALSRQMELHGDLLLITAYHWIATFLNTPRSPGSRQSTK